MRLAMVIAAWMVLISCAVWAEEGTIDLAKAPEACSLVSKEEVQKIAGEALADPKPEKGASSEKVKVTQCTYASADGMKSMSMLLRISNAMDNSPDYAKQTMKDSGMAVEDISGVGDSAFFTAMQLQAFKGKSLQVVISVFGFGDPKEKATSLAKMALEKLKAAGL